MYEQIHIIVHGYAVIIVCSPDGWALHFYSSSTVTPVFKSSHWPNNTRRSEISPFSDGRG